MHIEPANLHISCEHAGRPREKVSRYTGRPGTRGLTLLILDVIYSAYVIFIYLSEKGYAEVSERVV